MGILSQALRERGEGAETIQEKPTFTGNGDMAKRESRPQTGDEKCPVVKTIVVRKSPARESLRVRVPPSAYPRRRMNPVSSGVALFRGKIVARMETSPDSSGQRLRWWQEDAPQAQKWYSEPALVPAQTATPIPVPQQPLTFEEELEAEALRRTALERDAVVMEGSYANAEPKMRRQFAWLIGLTAPLYLAMAIASQNWILALFPLLFVAEFFILKALIRKSYAGKKSQIVLSSLGLTADLQHYRIGPVFWDEIASVRVVKTGFGSYVRVKLKDAKKTHERALTIKPGPMGWLIRLSLRSTHIEIMDQWFPQSFQEIAAQIAIFRPSSPDGGK